MKDTTKENMPREEAYNNSDVEAPKEETAISSEKELLSMLAKIFGIEGETPEALISSAKRKKARAFIESRAKAERADRAYRARLAEANALAEEIEGFELESELSDPVFKALIKCGFDVRRAYELAHYDENMEKLRLESEQAGYEKAISQLRRGMLRPEENGSREQSGISEKKNVASLSGKGIRSILSRVENGAKIKF